LLADGTDRVHSAPVNAAAAVAEVEKVRAEVARHEGRDGKARTATRVRGRALAATSPLASSRATQVVDLHHAQKACHGCNGHNQTENVLVRVIVSPTADSAGAACGRHLRLRRPVGGREEPVCSNQHNQTPVA
jgi:hypothetical protein